MQLFLEIFPWILTACSITIVIILWRRQAKMEVDRLCLQDELRMREDQPAQAHERLLVAMKESSTLVRDLSRGEITEERPFIVRLWGGESLGLPEDEYLVQITLTKSGSIGPAPDSRRLLVPPSQYPADENGGRGDFRHPLEQPLLLAPRVVEYISPNTVKILGVVYSVLPSKKTASPLDLTGE